jgi:hypothetical protein
LRPEFLERFRGIAGNPEFDARQPAGRSKTQRSSPRGQQPCARSRSCARRFGPMPGATKRALNKRT